MTKKKPSDEPAAGLSQVPKMSKKPMARAVRIALFQREIRVRLSPAALDLLFARAEVISEGQRAMRGGRDSYFGSTMLTLDLPSLAPLLSDACDAGTARRLAALLESDADVAKRVQQLAERETERVAGAAAAAGRHARDDPLAGGQGLRRRRRRGRLHVSLGVSQDTGR